VRARRPVVALVLTITTATTGGAAVVIALGRAGAAAPPARAVTTYAPTGVAPTGATIRVDGAQVPAAGGFTVADALEEAGVVLQEGHYIAAVSQRRLGPDGRGGRVFVDGRPATPSTPLSGGEQITTQPGQDLVEPTETVEVAVPPPVPTALYVGGRDGVVRVVRGSLSHEQISRRLMRRPVAGHLVRRGAVALTFDDGPGQYWTRQILAMLRRHDVPATFCMVGRAVVERPWLVREVVRDGHALCDHTYSHDLALRSRPREQISLDIRRGARVITRASHGVRPEFFRAPGGRWSPALEREARDHGMTPLKWTVDPRDWARPGVRAIVRTVLQELRPGGVILLHDGGGRRGQTLDALRILLRKLPRLGYHFVLPPQPASPEPTPTAAPAA
jgi:peptidoglycan/xylan/chitin deacetylase (PgdA/CDA1 family)